MAYATAKKQNRILCVVLAILLAVAALLIAVTGGANRKREDDPPTDNKAAESSADSVSEKKDDGAASGLIRGAERERTKADESDGESDEGAAREDGAESASDSDADADKTVAAEVSSGFSNELPAFIVPVDGALLKEYSVDVPVFSCTMNDYRAHNGVDLLCENGASVVAPADGAIGRVWEDPMMGISVSVVHSGGAVTVFRGLAPETMDFIQAGTEVKAGQVIAACGDTALIECGEEPHIHMEMSVNGELIDPAEYIAFTRLSETYEDS